MGVDEGVDVDGGAGDPVAGVNCGNSVMASFSGGRGSQRVVEDARAGLLGAFEQPGGGDVFEVEGRVLAHQHGVEIRERHHRLGAAGGVPGVVEIGHADGQAARRDDAAFHISASRWMAKLVAAAGGRPHHGDAGILVGLELVEGSRMKASFIGRFRQAVASSSHSVSSISTEAASSASRATTP